MVLKIDDIDPDGVRIIIQWDRMPVGASVFIPCVNTDNAVKQVKKICERKGFRVDCRVRIEGKKLGIRVWRTS